MTSLALTRDRIARVRPGPALAAATRVWRDFFPAREEVYRFGHDFLRDAYAKA